MACASRRRVRSRAAQATFEGVLMSASEDQILRALPMVRRLASRFAGTPLGAQDALGVGALALVEAGLRFDPHRDVPFEGFAVTRVRGAMRDAYSAARGSHGGRPEAELPHDPAKMAELFTDPTAARPDGRLDLLAAFARLGRDCAGSWCSTLTGCRMER